MRRWILSTFLLVSLLQAIGQEPPETAKPRPVSAPAAESSCANITAVIQAAPGDSFISLFGNHWEMVAACNRFTAVRDDHVVTSPDLLVAGTWIRIPAGTPLTPVAAARAGALEQRRLALLDQLNRLPLQRLDADGQGVAKRCRALLTDNLRFAPDEQFAARELAYLEEMAAHPAPTMRRRWSMQVVAAVSCLLLLALVLVAVKMRGMASPMLRERHEQARAELAKTCARAGIRFGP